LDYTLALLQVFPVLSGIKFSITALAAHRSKLYVGCEDGTLRIFQNTAGN
jgi:hypothetical protein